MVRKQAVLIIHGIGEQKPLETLRKFVRAAWTFNGRVHHKWAGSNFWSKPDRISESYELRMFTTPRNKSGVSTDFFELYWAHLMEGTTYAHVWSWLKTLLLRRPGTLPKQLQPVYWMIITLLLLAGGLLAYTIVQYGDRDKLLPTWLSTLLTLAVLPALGGIIKNILGDAARYLHPAPQNVQSRHAIREAGTTVLRALHKRGYERIVVVGHSLGSVIGYDVLKHEWSYISRKPKAGSPATALDSLEAMLQQPQAPSAQDFRAAQRAYLDELKANGIEWRVTDFVTLGSPLAHAAALLARDGSELRQRIEDFELPTCPPQLEARGRDGVLRFSYPARAKTRTPHHAAPFAATRWTNLYFPCTFVFHGDVIGGPLESVFGRGILDVPVKTDIRHGFLSHTHYWSIPGDTGAQPDPGKPLPSHIDALCAALDIADDGYAVKATESADDPAPDEEEEPDEGGLAAIAPGIGLSPSRVEIL